MATEKRTYSPVIPLPAPRPVSDRYPTEPLNADAAAALSRLNVALGFGVQAVA